MKHHNPFSPNEKYTKKAREQNYRARSVYKLEQLDKKFRLIKPDMKVLDIGAAPGSWMQYTSQKIGENGHVLGLDLSPIEYIGSNTTTAICDITNLQQVEQILTNTGWEKADLILSDIAPNTSGINALDHGRSIDLNKQIVEIAKKHLNKNSHLVMKVFEGSQFQEFTKSLKKDFAYVVVTKVQATREQSNEKYIICKK